MKKTIKSIYGPTLYTLELVDCSNQYWEFVRLLRMNPKVIDGFIQTTQITKDMQIDYMKKYSENYKICLYNETPVGYVGCIDNDMRYCVDPEWQGRSIGTFMLEEAKKIWPNGFCKIKIDNIASQKIAEKCGYKQKYIIYE